MKTSYFLFQNNHLCISFPFGTVASGKVDRLMKYSEVIHNVLLFVNILFVISGFIFTF